MAEASTTGVLSRGDVFIGIWQGGVLLPERYQVDAVQFKQKINAELITRLGKGRDNWGQVIGSVAKINPADVSLSFNGITAELLAMLFLGTVSALNVTGGTVTAESKTLKHNVWIKLDQKNVSAVTITGSVVDVDFKIDPRLGLIKALATGNLADNTSQSIAYAYGAITGSRILAGTKSQFDISIEFVGEWIETGELVDVEIPKMTIIPKSEINLLSDNKYEELEFNGQPLKLANRDASIIINHQVVNA